MENKHKFVSISLNKDNELFINKESIIWKNLDDKVSYMKKKFKDELVIFIAADKRSQHQYFVRILDSLNRNNITNVNIETSNNK